ncbi:MAG: DUF6036 family nucleotidyltransferase [Actinomycetota bacterium]|nr:DUF6036 family nucleotidyltransferase [Actinomycetota bacterium]
MNREEIVTALTALGAELHDQGIAGEMYVVGGAAISLAFDAQRSTRDVDAVFEPKTAVYAAAASVAERFDLAPDWLNDAVKGFLAGDDPEAVPVLEIPGLRCLVASPRMLLALKVRAHRRGHDEDDIRLLAQELGLVKADDVLKIAEDAFGDRLDPAAQFLVQELFGGDSA